MIIPSPTALKGLVDAILRNRLRPLRGEDSAYVLSRGFISNGNCNLICDIPDSQ